MSDVQEAGRQLRPCFTMSGVRRGMIEIMPVAAFLVPFGLAFGVAASAKGVQTDVSLLMSIVVFAGAAQFAVLDLWYAPLPLVTIALTVLAVNARHLLLGAALAPWLLQVPLARRALALLTLSDANFAYATAAKDRGEVDAGILLGSGLAMWLIWIAGTAVGALAGASLGDLSYFGFDAVMLTYFAAIVVGQWKGRPDLVPWLCAAVVASAGSYLLPAGWHIIAGALAGGLVGAWRHG